MPEGHCWYLINWHFPHSLFSPSSSTPAPWVFLQLVSLLLIGIAAWGIGFGLISSLRVVGVVIAVGIFLFLIALVGLIGAVKHHQVLLFFVSFLKIKILLLMTILMVTTNLILSLGNLLPESNSKQALCIFVQELLETFLRVMLLYVFIFSPCPCDILKNIFCKFSVVLFMYCKFRVKLNWFGDF